ncbi:hypothetical protein [Clostridium perfringens]
MQRGTIVGKYTYDENGSVILLKGNGVTDANGVVTFYWIRGR